MDHRYLCSGIRPCGEAHGQPSPDPAQPVLSFSDKVSVAPPALSKSQSSVLS